MRQSVSILAVIALAMPVPVTAQESTAPESTAPEIDFGDDTSQFARDGECDDSRFEGSGMTDTLLLESDIGHDATDCRVAFEQERLRVKATAPQQAAETVTVPIGLIDFGNDSGSYPNDAECDDARFVGDGMAKDLVTDTIGKDASDCRRAFEEGRVKLNALYADPTDENPIDFGVNTAAFANDGECDDIRFTGDYASGLIYLAEDIGRDANDCRNAVEAGTATWQGKTATPNYGMITSQPAESGPEFDT